MLVVLNFLIVHKTLCVLTQDCMLKIFWTASVHFKKQTRVYI